MLIQQSWEILLAVVARQNPSDSKNLIKAYRTGNFQYNESTDTYTCPQGHILSTRNKIPNRNPQSIQQNVRRDRPHPVAMVLGHQSACRPGGPAVLVI